MNTRVRPVASFMVQVRQPIIQEGHQNFIILHLSRNKNSVPYKINHTSTYWCLERQSSNNQISNTNFLFKINFFTN